MFEKNIQKQSDVTQIRRSTIQPKANTVGSGANQESQPLQKAVSTSVQQQNMQNPEMKSNTIISSQSKVQPGPTGLGASVQSNTSIKSSNTIGSSSITGNQQSTGNSVDALKSVFEKSATTRNPPGQGLTQSKTTDNSWIKNKKEEEKQEQVKPQTSKVETISQSQIKPQNEQIIPGKINTNPFNQTPKGNAGPKDNPFKAKFEQERAAQQQQNAQKDQPKLLQNSIFSNQQSKQTNEITSSRNQNQSNATNLQSKTQETILSSKPKEIEIKTQQKPQETIIQSLPKAQENIIQSKPVENIIQSQPKVQETIISSKPQIQHPPIKTVQDKQIPPQIQKQEQQEVIKSTTIEEKKQEAPKKLVISDVFGQKPKANPIPPKKDVIPKKLDNPFQNSVSQTKPEALKKENKDAIFSSVKQQIPDPIKQTEEPKITTQVEIEAQVEINSQTQQDKEQAVKKKGLFEDSDEDSDNESKDVVPDNSGVSSLDKQNLPPPLSQPPLKQSQSVPLQQTKPVPRTSAQPVQSTESNEFKNSLESLLARGNPLMTGIARKQTVVKPAKQEEEQREKIKFDIFADEEPGLNKYKSTAPMLDNDANMMKPQLLKNKAISKQYDFDLFGSDEEDN